MNGLTRSLLVCACALVLTACEEEETAPKEEVIRSIKHMTLGERAGAQERRIAGLVAASVSTDVAFETSGQVVELLREIGDEVNAGDLMARLDPEPYQLRVAEAENGLAQANATLEDAQKKFDQQKRLRQQGFATQTALDSAEATLKNAQGAVGVATSQVDLARRDLAKTDLKAPFEGVIARRSVDVFQEVSGGQVIYSIQSAGDDKIEASLPETLINTVSLGTEVEVRFPPLGGLAVKGTIDTISPLTGDANAYPIEILLETTPTGLRPGMSAEVVFLFASAETGKAFVVPLSAVLPNPEPGGDANVYVFDQGTKTLQKRAVQVVNVRNNELQVLGDLAEGEIIATAGVSFLYDGMQVELFDAGLLQ
jgi:RND family efflux transporter MFP subunit